LEALDQAGIAAESIDIAISNCVINLSPDKPTVLKQVYRVLKSGGEFYFSDVFCDRRLPEKVRADRILYGECISGALYINDFLNAAHSAGFADVRWVESREIEVSRPEHKALIGDARFSSITWRCFKVDDLELSHENYGQSAQYKGTISEDAEYVFDQIIRFKKGEKVSVCGNTAKILSHSWLGAHFDVFGDQSVHFGQFEGSHPSILQKDCSDSGSSCCPGETAKSACC
jgi:SAM-dependent methyltransferase